MYKMEISGVSDLKWKAANLYQYIYIINAKVKKNSVSFAINIYFLIKRPQFSLCVFLGAYRRIKDSKEASKRKKNSTKKIEYLFSLRIPTFQNDCTRMSSY